MATTDEFLKLLMAGGTSAVSAVNPAAVGLELAPEVGKAVLAATQAAKSRKLERSTRRPVYAPTSAQEEALATQRNAMGLAPGLRQQALLSDRAAGSSINAIQATGGGTGEKMAALANVDQIGQETALRQGAEQDQYASTQNQALQRALAQYGEIQQKAWEYNKALPYQQISEKAAQLGNAANMNAYDAAKSAGGAIAAGIGFDRHADTPTTIDPDTGLRVQANSGMMGDAASKIIGTARTPVNAKNPLVSQKVEHVATVDANDVTPQYQPFDEASYKKATGLPSVMIRSKDARMGFKDQTIENPDLNFQSEADKKKAMKFNPDTGQMEYDFNSVIPPYKKPYRSVADPLARYLAR